MTDFLTRLAQRTLGLAPVVQPRIASRYAPSAEGLIAGDDVSSAPSHLESTSDSRTTSGQVVTAQTPTELLNAYRSPFSSSSEFRLPLTQIETTIASLKPLIHSVPNAEQNSSLTTSNPKTSPSDFDKTNNPNTSLIDSSKIHENHSKHLTSSSQVSSLSAERSLVNKTKDFPTLISKDFESQSAHFLPQSLIQPEQKAQIHPANLPLVPPATTKSSSIPSGIQEANIKSTLVIQDDGKPSSVHFPSSVVSSITQPEPTIEIRIGRIEVRGIQPETTKPRPKSTSVAPALSLNDYLHKRDGGKQ